MLSRKLAIIFFSPLPPPPIFSQLFAMPLSVFSAQKRSQPFPSPLPAFLGKIAAVFVLFCGKRAAFSAVLFVFSKFCRASFAFWARFLRL